MSFFFFQAEDGIRDTSVTGVQTCALPIWSQCHLQISSRREPADNFRYGSGVLFPDSLPGRSSRARRSEERRVGKECRCWSGWYQRKRKRRSESIEQSRSSIGPTDLHRGAG